MSWDKTQMDREPCIIPLLFWSSGGQFFYAFSLMPPFWNFSPLLEWDVLRINIPTKFLLACLQDTDFKRSAGNLKAYLENCSNANHLCGSKSTQYGRMISCKIVTISFAFKFTSARFLVRYMHKDMDELVSQNVCF